MTLNRVRLYKEFRLLAPVWLLGVFSIVVLTLAARFDSDEDRQIFLLFASYGVYTVFTFVIAAMPFGSEFDYGTLQTLISQPVPGIRIWREKNQFF